MTTSMVCDAASKTFFGRALPFTELTPEASPRRYFRPQCDLAPLLPPKLKQKATSWLLVLTTDGPPIATTHFLLQHKIRVPQLGPHAQGAYLVEDLGDQHLWHQPTPENYQHLSTTWHRLLEATLPAHHPNASLRLDESLFQRELDMFVRCYLEAYRGHTFSPQTRQEITLACQRLAALASQGPQCLQHRDFHSRNILLLAEGKIAWIDHQDLRQGPLFYDYASLYTDAYTDLSDEVYQQLNLEREQLGRRFQLSAEQSLELFHHCALQRVLKALGTFGNLLAQGRKDYFSAEQRARPMALALCDMRPTTEARILREVLQG